MDPANSALWDLPASDEGAGAGLEAHVDAEGATAELDKTLQEEQCGLVTYSSKGSGCGYTFTTSDINCALNFNYQPIRNEMNTLSSKPIQGNTAIGAGIEKLFRPNTRAVFTEAPGSQSFEMQDIPAITAVAHARDALVLMDNTWATPL
mgnify:CR=1 FL=1